MLGALYPGLFLRSEQFPGNQHRLDEVTSFSKVFASWAFLFKLFFIGFLYVLVAALLFF